MPSMKNVPDVKSKERKRKRKRDGLSRRPIKMDREGTDQKVRRGKTKFKLKLVIQKAESF
jgi:hypothetical protein